MTSYERRKTLFTQRMAEDMQVRNFSPRTIDSYTYHVDRYAKHFAKDPEQLGSEDVRNFQLWMIREKSAIRVRSGFRFSRQKKIELTVFD